MTSHGIILAAPASGSGKTTITLGLLRANRNLGQPVRSAKSGPDYIDPRFHEAATGLPCPNLDAWAMKPERIRALAARDGLLVIEGAMGLFDGALPDGKGATADLARILGLPVVLIIDAARQGQSVAAIAQGFARHRVGVGIAAIILNKVASARHERILRTALDATGIPVLGAIPRSDTLALPSRHLGLVQAGEHVAIEEFLETAAGIMAQHIDLAAFRSFAKPLPSGTPDTPPLPPPAQTIAIARDEAFAFSYPHILSGWRNMGAELSFFSPLADQAPDPSAEFIFLPGGYPELHAGRLAAANIFKSALTAAARSGTAIYGECGGYMVLGETLTDADGKRYAMLGLLRLQTSFAQRKLHLGYRSLKPLGGSWQTPLTGHEFHYATTLAEHGGPLFEVADSEGNPLGNHGLCDDRISGSFQHVIDRA